MPSSKLAIASRVSVVQENISIVNILFKNPYPKWYRIWGPVVFIIAFLIFIRLQPSIDEIICDRYPKLLQHEFQGVVVNKFLDEKEHMYPMIILENYLDTISYNLVNDVSGLYQHIEIGDSVSKHVERMKLWLREITKQELLF